MFPGTASVRTRCRLLARLCYAGLFSADLRFQRIVLGSQRPRHGLRVLLGVPEELLLLLKRRPSLHPMNQSLRFDIIGDRHMHSIRHMRSGFVFLNHRLDSALRISARTDQVLLGIIGFVLVQLLLCPLRRLSPPAAAAPVSPWPRRLIPVDAPRRQAPPRQRRGPSRGPPAAGLPPRMAFPPRWS